MTSKNGMFNSIDTLREETGKKFDYISSRQCQTLWNIYQRCSTHREFEQKAKAYLGW